MSNQARKTNITAYFLLKTLFKKLLLALVSRTWWQDPKMHKPSLNMMLPKKKFPEYSRTSKCSVMHIPTANITTSLYIVIKIGRKSILTEDHKIYQDVPIVIKLHSFPLFNLSFKKDPWKMRHTEMQTCPKLKINNAGLMFCFFLASISLMLFREHRLTLEISYILPCKTRAYFVSTPFPLVIV